MTDSGKLNEEVGIDYENIVHKLLEYKFVYYAFVLKSSWRGRVDESSSSPEGRNSIEREESGDND